MIRKKLIKILSIVVLLISVVVPVTVNAEETTYGQFLDDLAKAEKDLKNNQNSINGAKGQINSDNATINKLKKDIDDMKVETENLIDEIAKSTEEIANKKQQTKSVIAYLQMSGGENAYLDYVFGSESITDVVYRLAVVEQITEHNDKVVGELEELIQANENRKVELAKKEEQYETKIDNLNSEISKLNNTVSALGDLSPGLEQEVKTKRDLVEFYKSQGCKNRGDVIGRDCAVTSSNGIFFKPTKKGYINSFVDYRTMNGKRTFHRGLDIGSPDGRNTALYSIGYGRITSIWKDGAGAQNVNIEYYKNGVYYTAIYAHLSRYGNIHKNMDVTPDTIIGYMGDTGYVTGVHLHIELWPCRIYVDNNCKSWDSYSAYAKRLFDTGKSHGAETYINFPSRTYQYWYSR